MYRLLFILIFYRDKILNKSWRIRFSNTPFDYCELDFFSRYFFAITDVQKVSPFKIQLESNDKLIAHFIYLRFFSNKTVFPFKRQIKQI